MSIDEIIRKSHAIERINDNREKRKQMTELINDIEKDVKEGLDVFYAANKSNSNSTIYEKAEKTAIMLYLEGITTTQLRKFYDRVKRLKYEDSLIELELIKAQIAYAAGKNRELERFYQIIRQLISMINSEESLKLFKTFFEAVVAYNRYHAKKE